MYPSTNYQTTPSDYHASESDPGLYLKQHPIRLNNYILNYSKMEPYQCVIELQLIDALFNFIGTYGYVSFSNGVTGLSSIAVQENLQVYPLLIYRLNTNDDFIISQDYRISFQRETLETPLAYPAFFSIQTQVNNVFAAAKLDEAYTASEIIQLEPYTDTWIFQLNVTLIGYVPESNPDDDDGYALCLNENLEQRVDQVEKLIEGEIQDNIDRSLWGRDDIAAEDLLRGEVDVEIDPFIQDVDIDIGQFEDVPLQEVEQIMKPFQNSSLFNNPLMLFGLLMGAANGSSITVERSGDPFPADHPIYQHRAQQENEYTPQIINERTPQLISDAPNIFTQLNELTQFPTVNAGEMSQQQIQSYKDLYGSLEGAVQQLLVETNGAIDTNEIFDYLDNQESVPLDNQIGQTLVKLGLKDLVDVEFVLMSQAFKLQQEMTKDQQMVDTLYNLRFNQTEKAELLKTNPQLLLNYLNWKDPKQQQAASEAIITFVQQTPEERRNKMADLQSVGYINLVDIPYKQHQTQIDALKQERREFLTDKYQNVFNIIGELHKNTEGDLTQYLPKSYGEILMTLVATATAKYFVNKIISTTVFGVVGLGYGPLLQHINEQADVQMIADGIDVVAGGIQHGANAVMNVANAIGINPMPVINHAGEVIIGQIIDAWRAEDYVQPFATQVQMNNIRDIAAQQYDNAIANGLNGDIVGREEAMARFVDRLNNLEGHQPIGNVQDIANRHYLPMEQHNEIIDRVNEDQIDQMILDIHDEFELNAARQNAEALQQQNEILQLRQEMGLIQQAPLNEIQAPFNEIQDPLNEMNIVRHENAIDNDPEDIIRLIDDIQGNHDIMELAVAQPFIRNIYDYFMRPAEQIYQNIPQIYQNLPQGQRVFNFAGESIQQVPNIVRNIVQAPSRISLPALINNGFTAALAFGIFQGVRNLRPESYLQSQLKRLFETQDNYIKIPHDRGYSKRQRKVSKQKQKDLATKLSKQLLGKRKIHIDSSFLYPFKKIGFRQYEEDEL